MKDDQPVTVSQTILVAIQVIAINFISMTRYIVLYLFGIVLAAIAVSGEPPIRHKKTITLLWPLAVAVIVAIDISTIIYIILNRDKD